MLITIAFRRRLFWSLSYLAIWLGLTGAMAAFMDDKLVGY